MYSFMSEARELLKKEDEKRASAFRDAAIMFVMNYTLGLSRPSMEEILEAVDACERLKNYPFQNVRWDAVRKDLTQILESEWRRRCLSA